MQQETKVFFHYFESMCVEFPMIVDELNIEDTDMIFNKMEIFATYTNNQISLGNTNETLRCFNFIEMQYDSMNELLLNALSVSYCEALLLGKNSSIMNRYLEIMPNKLKHHYLEYEQYYEKLIKNSQDE